MVEKKINDIVIVGAGPAGLTASIYAARAGLSAVVLDELGAGGQLLSIDNLENYPGFPEGINGFEAAYSLQAQAERFGAVIESDKAVGISVNEGNSGDARFVVQGTQHSYPARSVVIATGAKPVPLPIDGAAALVGKGISYCATCDGNFFRDKDVIVVGGGDSAVADVVLKARPWYAKQLKGIENLVVHWNCIVSDVLQEEGRVSGARLKNVLTGETSTIRAQGIFVAIGARPDAAWLDGIVELDESGYIIADEGGATSVPGLFAAGDVRTTPLRQVVTAVSDGALAAEAAASFLSSC